MEQRGQLPIGRGLKLRDRLIAIDDDLQCGRLYPPHREGLPRFPMAEGKRPGGIQADEPIGMRTGLGGLGEGIVSLCRFHGGERLLNGRRRVFREPQAVDGFLDARYTINIAKDELAWRFSQWGLVEMDRAASGAWSRTIFSKRDRIVRDWLHRDWLRSRDARRPR